MAAVPYAFMFRMVIIWELQIASVKMEFHIIEDRIFITCLLKMQNR